MTFIPVNFDDVQEPKPAPAGNYNLQILKAEVAVTGPNSNRPGSPQFKIQIGFPDEPNTTAMSQYMSLPHEDDDPNKAQYKALLLKRFLTLFNVPFDSTGIDTEKLAMEMIGATAQADVELSEPSDSGDVYNRLKVPRMRGESTGPGRARPPSR
jgi:hypothetical protein